VRDERRVSPVFGIRFRAYGRREYVTLGSAADGWTQPRAADELQNVLADVRRGIWRPPDREPVPVPAVTDPTFHEFASLWFDANEASWRPKTRVEWQLTNHLLSFFADHRLSQITIAEVDRYRAAKVREGVLSATSINKTITRLAQILELAVEYDMLARNPAKGKRRRVKASKPAPVWLDRAEQVSALLAAAGELDREAREDRQHVARRAILATLVFVGLRIGELCELRWRDVDLSGGRITVRASKTDAGVRQIDMLPVLRDELLALKAQADHRSSDLVFGTATGASQNPSNIRNRVLAPAVKRANERLADAGEVPLPERLSPHKLRHTFASLLVALGVDPGSVMDQLGHTDPAFTLRVYRHGMHRDESSRRALRRLVGVSDWAAMGSGGDLVGTSALSAETFAQQKTPR
jgi:integrase